MTEIPRTTMSRTGAADGTEAGPPFYVTRDQEKRLRVQAELLVPSLVVDQPSSFDEYVRQLMVPPAAMDLVRKAAHLRLAA
ncbi:hypothetical protein [Streptomyces rimosus]|uniref:hypothetical protein n=1 Tax=Streptomyces rimosus TaxID=1927 RepID=UPI0037AA5D3E